MVAINRLNIRHAQSVSILESVTESLELSGETIEYTLEYGEGTHTISLYGFNIAKWEVIGTEYPEQFQGTWAKYCLPDCTRAISIGEVYASSTDPEMQGSTLTTTWTNLVTGVVDQKSDLRDLAHISRQGRARIAGTIVSKPPTPLNAQKVAHQADRYYPAGKAYTDCGVEVTVADWVYKNEQQDYPTRHYVGEGLPVPFHSTGLVGNNLGGLGGLNLIKGIYTCAWASETLETANPSQSLHDRTPVDYGDVFVSDVREYIQVTSGSSRVARLSLLGAGFYLEGLGTSINVANTTAETHWATNDPGEIKRAEPITSLNIYPERQTEPYTNTVTVRLPKELEPEFSSGLIITNQVDSSEGVYLPERITL